MADMINKVKPQIRSRLTRAAIKYAPIATGVSGAAASVAASVAASYNPGNSLAIASHVAAGLFGLFSAGGVGLGVKKVVIGREKIRALSAENKLLVKDRRIDRRFKERYGEPKKLGAGGMATVYLAIDKNLTVDATRPEYRVIKVPNEEIFDDPLNMIRFESAEARNMMQVSSKTDGVVRFYDLKYMDVKTYVYLLEKANELSEDPAPAMTGEKRQYEVDRLEGKLKDNLAIEKSRFSGSIPAQVIGLLFDNYGADGTRVKPKPGVDKLLEDVTRGRDPQICIELKWLLEPRVPYIVMEYVFVEGVPNPTLEGELERRSIFNAQRELIQYKEPFSEYEVLDFIMQTAQAMMAAQEMGIIHRDLKPANIFVIPTPIDGARRYKIADFGLAKDISPNPSPQLTRLNLVNGTPGYMSEEQWRPGSSLDQRADIYALGAIAYQMLTGRTPTKKDENGFAKPINEDDINFSMMRPVIVPALKKMLAFSAPSRYADWRACFQDMKRIYGYL